MRTCTECGQEKPLDSFWNRHYKCKPCANAIKSRQKREDPERFRAYSQTWRERNPGHARTWRLSKYGMTAKSFDALLAAQGGACGVCGTTDPGGRNGQWHIDHDHKCCPTPEKSCGKCVRGLLCQSCNMALGLFRDDPDIIARAIEYVRGELG